MSERRKQLREEPADTTNVVFEDGGTRDAADAELSPCSCSFSWGAELVAQLEKKIQISIKGHGVIDGLQTLYKFEFGLDGTCVDGNLRYDEPTKTFKPLDTTTGLKKPDWMTQGEWGEFLKIVPDIYSQFFGAQDIKVERKTDTCVEVRFWAEITSEGNFSVSIPIPDHAPLEISAKLEEAKPSRARAVWTICCCCGEGDGCWSARRDVYAWKPREFAGTTLSWVLNADLGGCKKVERVNEIPKLKVKPL